MSLRSPAEGQGLKEGTEQAADSCLGVLLVLISKVGYFDFKSCSGQGQKSANSPLL